METSHLFLHALCRSCNDGVCGSSWLADVNLKLMSMSNITCPGMQHNDTEIGPAASVGARAFCLSKSILSMFFVLAGSHHLLAITTSLGFEGFGITSFGF